MVDSHDLTTLIFAAIRVAEADGTPMSARDLAFMLIPREDVDLELDRLVRDGSVFQDGDLYRCDLSRAMSTSERRRIQDLLDEFEEVMRDRAT